MANNKEEKKEIAQEPKHTRKTEATHQKQSACPKSHTGLTGFTTAIALLAIGIALSNLKSNNTLQNQLMADNKTLMSEVKKLKQNQEGEQEKINAQAQALQQKQTEFQDNVDNINKELQTALSQKLYQNNDWLLLKARYYLELAQINAHWSDNPAATVALLNEADTLLKNLNSQKVFSVRQALAKEIILFKELPKLDITGILSQLDAAQSSVDTLTIKMPGNASEESTNTEAKSGADESNWKSHLNDSVNVLKSLVVIRRNDEEIKPLMSPLFESLLKESIRLNLQEAQWAVLNKNQEVYQLALKQAITNLNRTFNVESQNNSVLLEQLKELQKITLNQEKPESGQALPLLNQLIDTNGKGGNP